VLLADRGYDSDAIRKDVRARGGMPEIPTKRTAAFSTRSTAPLRLRNSIEPFINRTSRMR
jgi:hypothetical protein